MRICGSRSGTESQPARNDFLPRGQLQSSYWLGGGQKGDGVRRQSGSWQSGVDTDWVMNCPTLGRFHRRRILSIEPPSKLVYTWPTEGSDAEPEQVTVSFNRDGTETEVVILHERILVKTGTNTALVGTAVWTSWRRTSWPQCESQPHCHPSRYQPEVRGMATTDRRADRITLSATLPTTHRLSPPAPRDPIGRSVHCRHNILRGASSNGRHTENHKDRNRGL